MILILIMQNRNTTKQNNYPNNDIIMTNNTHTYMHACIQTYIRTYIHTCIQTDIPMVPVASSMCCHSFARWNIGRGHFQDSFNKQADGLKQLSRSTALGDNEDSGVIRCNINVNPLITYNL